jgi:hypothetical protein
VRPPGTTPALGPPPAAPPPPAGEQASAGALQFLRRMPIVPACANRGGAEGGRGAGRPGARCGLPGGLLAPAWRGLAAGRRGQWWASKSTGAGMAWCCRHKKSGCLRSQRYVPYPAFANRVRNGRLTLYLPRSVRKPGVFTSWLQPTEGRSIPSPRAVVQNTVDPWYCAAGIFGPARLCTKPSTTFPACAWAERHHPGVVGEPAAGCIPSVPPVGGWGRLGRASSWRRGARNLERDLA